MTPQEELAALEELARLEAQARVSTPPAPNKVVETGTSLAADLLRGGGKTVEGMGEGLVRTIAAKFGMDPTALYSILFPGAKGKTEEVLPTPKGDSPARQYIRAGLEAVPGAAVAAPQSFAAAPIISLTSAVAGGMGGKAGGDFTERVAGPSWRPLGELVGGVTAGGGTALAASRFSDKMRQTPVETELRLAMERMSPEEWREVSKNTNLLASTKTGTQAEAFPGHNQILALAIDARGKRGAEALTSRTSGRVEELTGLADEARTAVGPPVSGLEAANTGRVLAEGVRDTMKGHRTQAYQQDLGTASIPATEVATFYSILKRNAAEAQSVVEKEAYEAAAATLLQANKVAIPQPPKASLGKVGKAGFKVQQQTPQPDRLVDTPKTDVSSIAKDLKQMQERALSPSATGGQLLDSGAVRRRYQEVQEFLKSLSPEYQKAEAGYLQRSGPIDTLMEGPIGTLGGMNPNSVAQTPVSRLGALVNNQQPQNVAENVARLGTQLRAQDPDALRRIARAIVDAKMSSGTKDVGRTLRGMPGSDQEQQLATLIAGTGGDVRGWRTALQKSDLLQNLDTPVQAGGNVPESKLAAAATPFSTSARVMRQLSREEYYRQIAELLTEPSPQNLARLREIAMFDPSLRRNLMLSVGLSAGVQGAEK